MTERCPSATGLQILLLHLHTCAHDRIHCRQPTAPGVHHQKRDTVGPPLHVAVPCAALATLLMMDAHSERGVQRSYVVYPPEGPRPPTAEELIEKINRNKR